MDEASELEPESRGLILELAGEAVDPVDCNKAIDYFDLAFDATTRMDAGDHSNLRAKTQQTIVERLDGLDLGVALRLLQRADRPSMTTDPTVDLRAHATEFLVQSLLERNAPGDVDKAAELIAYVGRTGEYPYGAASPLIRSFEATGQRWRSARTFRDAMDAFAKGQEFKDSRNAFVGLIRWSEGSVSDDLRREAVRLVVDSIRDQQKSAEQAGVETKQFNLVCEEKELHFRSEFSLFVLNVLHVAAQIDSELAGELIRENPDIQAALKGQETAAALDSVLCNGGVGFYSGPQDPKAVEEGQAWLAADRARDAVRDLASTQPDDAVTQAEAIKHPGLRLEALVEVAAGLGQSKRDKTIAVLSEVERLADAAEDPETKVNALAGASEIWARLGDEKNAFRLIDVGFDFAESVLQRDQEESSYGVIQSPGAYLFVRLVWAETRISPERAAIRAHAISDRRLRALVLLNVAKTAPFAEPEEQL